MEGSVRSWTGRGTSTALVCKSDLLSLHTLMWVVRWNTTLQDHDPETFSAYLHCLYFGVDSLTNRLGLSVQKTTPSGKSHGAQHEQSSESDSDSDNNSARDSEGDSDSDSDSSTSRAAQQDDETSSDSGSESEDEREETKTHAKP